MSDREYGVYEVIGRRIYRGHTPGTRFEALIDPAAAQRAIDRGDIRLVRRVTPDLVAGSYRLPPGWLDTGATPTEAPTGASLIEKEGRR